MKELIGPAVAVAIIITLGLIVIKQQNKASPTATGCPPGSTAVVLTDGTTNCSVAKIEEIK